MRAADGAMRVDATTLAQAIAHLRAFRATLYDGDDVDPDSHLQAADLDIVIAAAERQLAVDRAGAKAGAGAQEGAQHDVDG
ncbi:hypothetical protein J2Y58_001228 [Sphingomonas sp. BE138]|uniref:hypothetical protein n=1 Tax=Sphingomonas sp. BE138 TaxID=2817845 RepID=UPI00285E5E81|nr:hypothetical protein [Sphingomonas sp. BE138]MDR6787876.1 hypothetical protein [Sphingomonas sp. BE138]